MYRRGGWTVSRRTLPSAAEEAIGINTRSGKEKAGGRGHLCYACYLNACCKYSVRRGKSSATAAARHSACLQLASSSNCSCLESREISRLALCFPVCVSLCACAAHCSSFRFRLPLPLPSLLLLLLSLLPFRGFEATFQFQFADGNAKR